MHPDALAERALEDRKRVAVEGGLVGARRLRENVERLRDALREDAAVVDAVDEKLAGNRARVEAEADALARTLRQVVLGSRQRRRMFGFLLAVVVCTGVLCRIT